MLHVSLLVIFSFILKQFLQAYFCSHLAYHKLPYSHLSEGEGVGGVREEICLLHCAQFYIPKRPFLMLTQLHF